MGEDETGRDPAGALHDLALAQGALAWDWMRSVLPSIDLPSSAPGARPAAGAQAQAGSALADSMLANWNAQARALQAMWQAPAAAAADTAAQAADPGPWLDAFGAFFTALPAQTIDANLRFAEEWRQLWDAAIQRTGAVAEGEAAPAPALPRADKRFADPRWHQPVFALIHQAYLLMAERITAGIDDLTGLEPGEREKLRFTTRAYLDALSPANFPLTNPVVLDRTLETGGENLVKGMQHLLGDLERGQLTHTDPSAFEVGRDLATTPGKVVHETPLWQLIQYSPTTEEVLERPLVIMPPWINRFYILDLNPRKSFVRWAVEQGLTVFMVSWKSADESLADLVWDDYIRAQIDAVDTVRARLGVDSVHAIGYCVAGTTLAATLAILARRGDAGKITSATFFTAQVDFARAGELLHFIDDAQIAAVKAVSDGPGYIDGRLLAATFNLLRGPDLIYSYIVNNYLLGEDYPAFDLLHWNGDVTNLPARWHADYLTDLYRDNRLVQPDSMVADGTPIDLGRVATPTYVQAGRDDHIAPAESVFEITRHLAGPIRFVLAGSGHIAGVVNPPDARKYQYWTNEGRPATLADYTAGATEHAGSWWPDWAAWIRTQDAAMVPVEGKRIPGAADDPVIEDAPGRYVKER